MRYGFIYKHTQRTHSWHIKLIWSDYKYRNFAWDFLFRRYSNKSVANLNYELPLPTGRMKDLTITGFGQSELDQYVERFAKEQDRYIVPESSPQDGIYYRSDHFSFTKVGSEFMEVRDESMKIDWSDIFALERLNHSPPFDANEGKVRNASTCDIPLLFSHFRYRHIVKNKTIFDWVIYWSSI